MGWSCTKEQGDTLDAIDKATGSVSEDGLVDGMFYEHPAGGPDGKDYGTPGALNMRLPVFRTWEADGQRLGRRIGYLVIKPDGTWNGPDAFTQAVTARLVGGMDYAQTP